MKLLTLLTTQGELIEALYPQGKAEDEELPEDGEAAEVTEAAEVNDAPTSEEKTEE